MIFRNLNSGLINKSISQFSNVNLRTPTFRVNYLYKIGKFVTFALVATFTSTSTGEGQTVLLRIPEGYRPDMDLVTSSYGEDALTKGLLMFEAKIHEINGSWITPYPWLLFKPNGDVVCLNNASLDQIYVSGMYVAK